ncbi:hypothetical protein EVAR_99439_1 [Eumeta japonica]|uniref:Uncharacterized protein n=1 Tax=Eumeta variegata TaxID=151549 RepID=A0A4C1ZC63_EUMVA|nr:hypothetical protein EVAR_99439_1 [Eumeta japonica]
MNLALLDLLRNSIRTRQTFELSEYFNFERRLLEVRFVHSGTFRVSDSNGFNECLCRRTEAGGAHLWRLCQLNEEASHDFQVEQFLMDNDS